MTVTLTESRPLAEAATPADGPARLLVKIISPGWGSSGYYSSEALQAAAGPEIFPAGTQMFLDHPTATEQWERPERTVKDLAAVTTEDARWDPSIGALVAEARVFAPWRQPIADMADSIGVSIRAAAEVEQGEAEGRRGTIITALTEGYSIDFVTKAGRGGAILAVREADVAEARNVGQWMEARIHQGFTNIADDMFADGRLTREERIALSSAIGDALTAFVQSVDANAPQLYARDLWDDPDDTPQVEETTPADEADPSVPTSPAGQSTATESHKEDTMAQTQIEESELATLRTDAGRATVLESERDTAIRERDEARQALVEAQDVAAAQRIVSEADAEFDDLQTAGLIAGAPRIAESGRIDLDAFKANVEERSAKLAESQGAGRVRGVGQTTTPEPTEDLSEADLDRELAKLTGRTVKEA